MPFVPVLLLVASFLHLTLAITDPFLPSSATTSRLFLASNSAACPCSVHVHRTRAATARRIGHSFDLLVVPKHEWDKVSTHPHPDIPRINFLARHSFLNVSDSSASDSDAFLDHFHERSIEMQGDFVVVLRSTHEHLLDPSEYIVRIRSVNHQSRSCPVMLGPDPPSQSRGGLQRQFAPEPRIVGGGFVSANLAPYLVVVYNPEKRFCSGTLLSDKWVITAAHCGVNKTFTVGLLANQAYKNGKDVEISRVFSHPNYGKTGPPRQNDITVIELKEAAPKGAKFMTLNSDKSRPKEGEFARVAGYGTISYMNAIEDEAPGSLRQVDVPITSYKECSETYNRWEIVSKRKQVCAGYFDDGGCDAW